MSLSTNVFQPRLDILPSAQLKLWNRLNLITKDFVLYGGTAIALHLGHRQSIDFDFFSKNSFNPQDIFKSIKFLENSNVVQQSANTLTCIVKIDEPIKVSFFGLPDLKAVRPYHVAKDNQLQIASMLDLMATKLLSIQQRSEAKDYIDIAALIKAGISLELGISAAKIVFGARFTPILSLKALVYYGDGDLNTLTESVKNTLNDSVKKVDLNTLPKITL